MKVYEVLDVAHYIVRICNEENKAISNLKLQKILYFIQAEFLVVKDSPCFKEQIEAWSFGPVVSKVYHYYKGYGASNIPILTTCYNDEIILKEDKKLIKGIVDECSRYSATQLVEITHKQAPWKSVYRLGYNNIIPNESIKAFFKED